MLNTWLHVHLTQSNFYNCEFLYFWDFCTPWQCEMLPTYEALFMHYLKTLYVSMLFVIFPFANINIH